MTTVTDGVKSKSISSVLTEKGELEKITPLLEVIAQRHSVRKFRQDPVSRDLIEAFIEVSRLAPKAHGTDVTNYHLLGKERKSGLYKALEKLFRANMGKHEKAGTRERQLKIAEIFIENNGLFFKDAPVVYIVTYDRDKVAKMTERASKLLSPEEELPLGFGHAQLCCNASVQQGYLELLLTAVGLGSCRVNSITPLLERIDGSLLPFDRDKEVIVGLQAIGYPIEAGEESGITRVSD